MPTIMAETVEINLSRALKLKNRVAKRVGQYDALLVSQNSTPEDNREYDAHALYRARTQQTALLVALKTAINAANQPIQHRIFQLAEAKSLIAVLKRVDTKNGPQIEGYSGTRVVYVAQMRKAEVDREVKRIEGEIDRIQDELDQFNYNTTIAIDPATLADEAPGLDALVVP